MAYAVFVNNIDKYVWIGIGLILLEGLVLLYFKKMCPLTIMARKYSDSTKENFDIYLPVWLARYNKVIYSIVFFVTVTLLVFKLIFKR